MRVYHFIDAKYGLDDISKRRLKIARIDQLNDPFELLAAYSPTPQDRMAWRGLKADCADKFGLLCFSRSWRNPVQWSHYADHHRGLCLGFDVGAENVKAVKYVTNRLPFDRDSVLGNQQVGEAYLEAVLSTKFSHWQYEQEMRMFLRLDPTTTQNGLYFFDFRDDLKLAEVIVGSASTIDRGQIRRALGSSLKDVKCRKARLAFKTFNIVEQRKSSLWR